MDKLSVKIAGEIALSDTPGGTMKKWREIFGVTQVQLGEYLGISASTISDYEGNRRKSPGIAVVRRFIDALVAIDAQRGAHVVQKFREEEREEKFFEVHDFSKAVDAKVIVNEELLREKKIYGYTLIDSIKVILELPYSEYPKLYGHTSERAFVFTEVSTGRSPMVVLRVTPIKPSIVVLHGLQSVDKLAIKIAQKERIPLLTTKLELPKISEALKKW